MDVPIQRLEWRYVEHLHPGVGLNDLLVEGVKTLEEGGERLATTGWRED
jgi:hypothetical protein